MFVPVPKPMPATADYASLQAMGQLQDGAPLIVVFRPVLEQIIEYSERDAKQEQGGFLLGGVHYHEGEYVEIRAFLPATETRSAAASLRFTHDTWAALNREVDERYPDELVVGWQHTHPNLGIFLSNQDLFIHKHFFSAPWQIAMVVDPVRQELGFFQWRRGEIIDCGCLCVG
jgi:proteasome lid subunit RPN8/RPN11